MCIIAVKEKQQRIWNREEIQKMMERNRDGAGFMFPENGKVRIIKGLMSVDEVVKTMESIENIESLPIVFHARIETSGGVKKGLTHPFALNREFFLSTDSLVDYGMAHNGVIQNTIKNSNWSDTVTFIDEEILPYMEMGLELEDIILEMKSRKGRELTNYSKFAFMDGNGKISLIGDFVKDSEGRKYSNTSYKGNFYSYGYSYPYGGISSIDDYYDYPITTTSIKGNNNTKTRNNSFYSYREKYAKYVDLVGVKYPSKNITFVTTGKTVETIVPDENTYPHCFITPSGDVYLAKKLFNMHDEGIEVYEDSTKLTPYLIYGDVEDNLY